MSESPISFSEAQGVRYLHFGSEWVQGAMRLNRPNAIEIDYCRHMMAWLLFLAPPQRILQLGLGAAALTKFCLHTMPQSSVSAVELSKSVIHAAHAAFALPRDNDQLEIFCQDAQEFVAKKFKKKFGVVQIDLYDHLARGPVCDSVDFYRNVHHLMDSQGSVCAINLFGEAASFPKNMKRIADVFEGRVVELPPVEAGNIVVLAAKGPSLSCSFEDLYERAQIIEQQYQLKARGWVNALKAQSRSKTVFSF
jgi:spermidine synthase